MDFTTFDTAAFAAEIANAAANREIGTALTLQNDRVRVWDLTIEPGERLPFHCHATAYFFMCVEGGRCISRFPDGNQVEMDYHDGETWFSEHTDDPEIHDLENVGDTRVRFVTVELL